MSEEVSFLNACFTDRFRNTQLSFQAFQPCQQFLNLRSSTVTRCAQTKVVCDFSVTTTRLRTVILAESSLLGWVVVSVITDNVADQQGVRQTVRNVELRTQLVRHRVANTQEGVRKRDTGDGCCTVNAFTCYRVFRPFVVGRWQVFLQQFQSLQSLTVRELRCQHRNVSFQGVSYRIQTTERTQ
ncbi:Uncharacterised protein [Enterobacter asburiae]|nr:Uncharacterised protein [Enterobacter cloacae]SAF89743.1 Uncharacterised protein [Enterobacter asburiae]